MAAGATSIPEYTGDSQLAASALEKYAIDSGLAGQGYMGIRSLYPTYLRNGSLASAGAVSSATKQIYSSVGGLHGESALAGVGAYASYDRPTSPGGSGALVSKAIQSFPRTTIPVGNGALSAEALRRRLYYREDFARVNGGLGPDWRNDKTPASRIISEGAQAGAVNSNTGRQAAGWHTYIGGSDAGRLATDFHYVRCQTKTSYPDQADNNYTTIYIGGPDTWTGGSWIALMISPGSGFLVLNVGAGSLSGPGGSLASGDGTTLYSSPGASSVATETWMLYKSSTTVVGVQRNGVSQWEASVAGLASSPTQRRWGFGQEANYPFAQHQYSSFGLEWIEAGDF
jgi:hypothetical protein